MFALLGGSSVHEGVPLRWVQKVMTMRLIEGRSQATRDGSHRNPLVFCVLLKPVLPFLAALLLASGSSCLLPSLLRACLGAKASKGDTRTG